MTQSTASPRASSPRPDTAASCASTAACLTAQRSTLCASEPPTERAIETASTRTAGSGFWSAVSRTCVASRQTTLAARRSRMTDWGGR